MGLVWRRGMTTLRATLSLVDSAVLAPVYRDPSGDLRLVFIRRSPHGIHGGQIAFPGGRIDVGEEPIAAALREANEELLLDPTSVDGFAIEGPGNSVGLGAP